MASKKALAFLAACGLAKVHTALELSNFAAGQGNKRFSLPYHVIRMRPDRSGDSKETVGWARDLADARSQIETLERHGSDTYGTQCGADSLRRDRWCYYIRDIRNGKIHRS